MHTTSVYIPPHFQAEQATPAQLQKQKAYVPLLYSHHAQWVRAQLPKNLVRGLSMAQLCKLPFFQEELKGHNPLAQRTITLDTASEANTFVLDPDHPQWYNHLCAQIADAMNVNSVDLHEGDGGKTLGEMKLARVYMMPASKMHISLNLDAPKRIVSSVRAQPTTRQEQKDQQLKNYTNQLYRHIASKLNNFPKTSLPVAYHEMVPLVVEAIYNPDLYPKGITANTFLQHTGVIYPATMVGQLSRGVAECLNHMHQTKTPMTQNNIGNMMENCNMYTWLTHKYTNFWHWLGGRSSYVDPTLHHHHHTYHDDSDTDTDTDTDSSDDEEPSEVTNNNVRQYNVNYHKYGSNSTVVHNRSGGTNTYNDFDIDVDHEEESDSDTDDEDAAKIIIVVNKSVMRAAKEGNYPQMMQALQRGGNPNYPSSHGRTPLMYAAQRYDIKSIRSLVQQGANPS